MFGINLKGIISKLCLIIGIFLILISIFPPWVLGFFMLSTGLVLDYEMRQENKKEEDEENE